MLPLDIRLIILKKHNTEIQSIKIFASHLVETHCIINERYRNTLRMKEDLFEILIDMMTELREIASLLNKGNITELFRKHYLFTTRCYFWGQQDKCREILHCVDGSFYTERTYNKRELKDELVYFYRDELNCSHFVDWDK